MDSIADSTTPNFNPRPPRGGRLSDIITIYRYLIISIHAPREGGDANRSSAHTARLHISIHAPREGGDFNFPERSAIFIDISIHAPREGGDFLPLVL